MFFIGVCCTGREERREAPWSGIPSLGTTERVSYLMAFSIENPRCRAHCVDPQPFSVVAESLDYSTEWFQRTVANHAASLKPGRSLVPLDRTQDIQTGKAGALSRC